MTTRPTTINLGDLDVDTAKDLFRLAVTTQDRTPQEQYALLVLGAYIDGCIGGAYTDEAGTSWDREPDA